MDLVDVPKKAVKGTVVLFASTALIRLIGFISQILLMRLLIPEDFGIMALAWLLINGIIACFLGLRTSVIQSQEEVDVLLTTILFTEPILATITTFSFYFLSNHIATFFNASGLASVLSMLSLVIIINSLSAAPIIKMEKNLEFKRRIFPEIIYEAGFPIIAVPLAFFGFGVWSLVYGALIGQFISMIFAWIIASWKPRIKFNLDGIKKILILGFQYSLSNFIVFLLINIDDGIVGKILDEKALGFYSIAFFLSNIPVTSMSHVIGRVAIPAYSILQNNKDELKKSYSFVFELIATVTIPMSIICLVMTYELTLFLFTERWLPIVGIWQVLCFYGLVRSLLAPCGDLIKSIGKINILIKANLIQVIVLIGFGIIATQKFGLIGISIVNAFQMALATVYVFIYVKRAFNVSFLPIFLPIFISCVPMTIFLLLGKLFVTDILTLFGVIFLVCLVYILLMLIQKPDLIEKFQKIIYYSLG